MKRYLTGREKMDQTNQIQKTIMDELGLNDLPEDKKQELMIKMTEVILKRMFLETMEKLKEEDREKYGQMIESQANPEDVEAFLREKIEGYDSLLEKVISDFKNEMTSVEK